MTDIYTRFDAATSRITAVALIYAGKVAGRVVIKFGEAATAYVQIWGLEMQSGRATGGGYDKATAAVEAAVAKLKPIRVEADLAVKNAKWALCSAFDGADGRSWEQRLETCGFTIARAI